MLFKGVMELRLSEVDFFSSYTIVRISTLATGMNAVRIRTCTTRQKFSPPWTVTPRKIFYRVPVPLSSDRPDFRSASEEAWGVGRRE